MPPKVKDEGATLFTASPPVLLTVIVTVMDCPGVTVAGVADMEDVKLARAKTKLEKSQ